MSIRTLLIWIIIAGLLGGAAVVVRQRHLATTSELETQWTGMNFDPASVVSIVIEGADDSVSIERDAASIDRWRGVWGDGNSWGLAASRVRGGLRALATARVRMSEEPLVQEPGRTVTITTRSGNTMTLVLGDDRSGGRAPVRVEQRDEGGAIERAFEGWLDSGVADAFGARSALVWRDKRLMNMAASSVTRIELSTRTHAVTLSRGAGGWRVTEPIGVSAGRERAEQLVRSLLAIKAVRFVEEVLEEETTGFSNPLARVQIGSEDQRYELIVGNRADLNSETLYALLKHDGVRTPVTISVDALANLTAVPDAYIAQTPGVLAATSVRGVRVTGRDGTTRFDASRDGVSWSQGDSPVDTLTAESIDRMLSLLLQRKANAVRLVDESFELPRAIAGVELIGDQGDVLASFDFALEQSGEGLRLLVVVPIDDGQRVVWGYSGDEAQATGTWLTITASRPANGG